MNLIFLIITSFGLFLGGLSFWVFFLGVSPLRINSLYVLIGIYLFILLFILILRKKFIFWFFSLPKFNLFKWLAMVVIFASSWRILLYGTFYPFIHWDNLAIYGLNAKEIFKSGTTLGFSGHPPLLSLLYAVIFFLTKKTNEQLAKIIPALLAIGTVGSTYYLGETIFSQKVGLIAAFLLSITPLFKKWSGAGYADISGTFYFILTIIYFYLWSKDKERKTLFLTGIFLGLSLWTKQSNLILLIALPVLFISYIKLSYKKKILSFLLLLFLAFLTGGFGYLRNFWLKGEFFPTASSWWGLAQPTSHNLLPFLTYLDDFGYWLSPLYAISFIFTLGLWKNKKVFLFLTFILPYLLLWWRFYSYETRFLLTILPLLANLCGFFIEEVFLKTRIYLRFSKAFLFILILGVSFSTLYSALSFDLLKEKSLTFEQKKEKYLGDAYKVFMFLKKKEEEKPRVILTTDQRLFYFLDKSKISDVFPKNISDFSNFDYFLFSPWFKTTSAREGFKFDSSKIRELENSNYFLKVFESGEYIVYEIKK